MKIARIRQLRNQELIKVCAWCGEDTYPPLKKNQAYTHGICLKHKLAFMQNILTGYTGQLELLKGGDK